MVKPNDRKSRIMEIVKEEIDKTETTIERPIQIGPSVNSQLAFDRGYKKGYENAKTKYIEKFEKRIRTKKEYYSNGWMCSIAESVQGESICEDILKYIEKLKEGEAE